MLVPVIIGLSVAALAYAAEVFDSKPAPEGGTGEGGDKKSDKPKRARMTPAEWVAHGRKLEKQEAEKVASEKAEREKEIDARVKAAIRDDRVARAAGGE